MEEVSEFIKTNKYQTSLTEELRSSLHKEVWNDLIEFIDSVKFINWLIQPENVRGFAKDRQKETEFYNDGRISVDITKPHILENMDFFRERALFFEKHGRYTHLRPNSNPKSEFAQFWKEELRRWKYGLVRESDGEWIPGGFYFYLNYSPIWVNKALSDNTGKKVKGDRKKHFPNVWLGDYLFFHYLDQAKNSGAHAKMLKTRGIGAEQPHSEIVKTFCGDKKVGDVVVGDKLIGIDGKETTVIDIYPQGEKDVYEVELLDKRKIRCGIDHLWYVNDLTVKRIRAVKLSEMIEKGLTWSINKGRNVAYKYKIPKLNTVEYPDVNLPIDPYVLGALLGDGALTGNNIRIATNDEFIIEEFSRRLPNYSFNRDKTNNNYLIVDNNRFLKNEYNEKYENSKYGINKLKRDIRCLNLDVATGEKFIPEIYLRSGFNQRLELLQGLMDTDGSISANGMMEFSNSNYKLIQDVASLCRSLGIKATIGFGRPPRKKMFGDKECDIKQEYRIYINTNLVIFKLPRKVNRCRDKKLFDEYPIVSIKKLGYKEKSSCFLVDNETHTYLTGDYVPTHNSYKLASLSPRNMYIEPGLPNFHLASDKSFLDGEKGVYGKVLDVLDWIADSTPLPKMRLINSPRSREVQLGYADEYGVKKGLKSSVYGISLKDNPDKARGVRGPLIHYEEDGLFPNLEKAWSVNRKAVEDGDIVYGQMCALGTGGTEGADFEGSEKLFRNPLAYNIYGIPNVFDKNSNGESLCGFFWGAYLNRSRCYDEINGEPDVVKALVEILNDRFVVKYNSSDPSVITQKLAEEPITPSEAVMRTSGTIFPVADLKDYRDSVRIQGQRYFDAHYVGELVATNKGIEWKPSNDVYPIRRFPTGTDKPEGAIEIFEMPKTDHNGKIDPNRYIAGIDPIDDDHSGTDSLASIMIMDLYTDRIVAEFTGRPKFANDFYEICRRMLLFYNAKANYENDKKGLFAYFDQKRCLHLLCETPQILRDMEYVKVATFGNKSRGTNSGKMINAWGRRLQKDWMQSVATAQDYDENGEQIGVKLNMHTIRGIAYVEELIAWNPDINADRVSCAGMLMIYREDRLKYLTKGSSNKDDDEDDGFLGEYGKNFENAYDSQISYEKWQVDF